VEVDVDKILHMVDLVVYQLALLEVAQAVGELLKQLEVSIVLILLRMARFYRAVKDLHLLEVAMELLVVEVVDILVAQVLVVVVDLVVVVVVLLIIRTQLLLLLSQVTTQHHLLQLRLVKLMRTGHLVLEQVVVEAVQQVEVVCL